MVRFTPANKEQLRDAIHAMDKRTGIHTEHGHINDWDVSRVTNMTVLFSHLDDFNQPLNNWNVSNVTNMSYMFFYCHAFNQPLNHWNVSNVTNMQGMFYNCHSFNQPLDN
jgi:surface protein